MDNRTEFYAIMKQKHAQNSIVTIQLGQAGNQIGYALFDTLSKEMPGYEAFFRESSQQKTSLPLNHKQYRLDRTDIRTDNEITTSETMSKNEMKKMMSHGSKPIARAIQIDMEPKVIQSMREQTQSSSFSYDTQNFLFKQSGSGNNWAFGYNKQGPSCTDEILDLVRLELEQSDCSQGFLLLHSAAGGTGSGVGCYVTELLRDTFPKMLLSNVLVWPYIGGEVIIQNYNVILSLAKLYEHSDMIFMYENDTLNTICQRLLGLKSPSFKDMNQVLADSMSNILLPSYQIDLPPFDPNLNQTNLNASFNSTLNSSMNITNTTINNTVNGILSHGAPTNNLLGASVKSQLWLDYIDQLVPHPAYKLVTARSIPILPAENKSFSTYQWHGLLKHTFQMQIADGKFEESINWYMNINSPNVNRSVSNLLICRGKNFAEALPYLNQFQDPRLYPSWTRAFNPFKCFVSPPVSQTDRSAVILSNSQSVIKPIDNTLDKANKMFGTGAYLHNYEKYGIDKDTFKEKIIRVEQVLNDYKNLSSPE